jgi:hypothetical protein
MLEYRLAEFGRELGAFIHRESEKAHSRKLRRATEHYLLTKEPKVHDLGRLPLIGEELTLIGDPHPLALGILDLLYVHLKVYGAHYAVAKFFVD